MKSALAVISFILLIVISGGLYYYSTYMNLNRMNSNINKAWDNISKDIDQQISIVKKLAKVVKEQLEQMDNQTLSKTDNSTFNLLFKNIDKLPNNITNQRDKKMQINKDLENITLKLLDIAGKYPQIKANETFTDQLGKLENAEKIMNKDIKAYNSIVEKFNKSIKNFPANIIAKKIGLKEEPLIMKNSKNYNKKSEKIRKRG